MPRLPLQLLNSDLSAEGHFDPNLASLLRQSPKDGEKLATYPTLTKVSAGKIPTLALVSGVVVLAVACSIGREDPFAGPQNFKNASLAVAIPQDWYIQGDRSVLAHTTTSLDLAPVSNLDHHLIFTSRSVAKATTTDILQSITNQNYANLEACQGTSTVAATIASRTGIYWSLCSRTGQGSYQNDYYVAINETRTAFYSVTWIASSSSINDFHSSTTPIVAGLRWLLP